jgi:hypothetical protein
MALTISFKSFSRAGPGGSLREQLTLVKGDGHLVGQAPQQIHFFGVPLAGATALMHANQPPQFTIAS